MQYELHDLHHIFYINIVILKVFHSLVTALCLCIGIGLLKSALVYVFVWGQKKLLKPASPNSTDLIIKKTEKLKVLRKWVFFWPQFSAIHKTEPMHTFCLKISNNKECISSVL